MRRIFLVPLAILLLATLILGSCAQPAPTLAPAPTPTPAPTPKPTPAPAPAPAPAPGLPVPGMKPGEENLYFEYVYASGSARYPPPAGFEKSATENFFDELEKATGGRFKVRYAYGGILGSAQELPHLAGAGVCDMGTLTGPDPAEFTYLSMPGAGWYTMDMETNVKLAKNLYRHPLSTEVFDGINLVHVWTHSYPPNVLHIRKGVKPIEKAEDLKGLQMGAWTMVAKLWAPGVGMVPVSLGSPFDTYEGMQKGMIDMVAMDVGALGRPFNLGELVGQVLETGAASASTGFGYMNKDAWNRLPQYIKDLWWELCPTEMEEMNVKTQMADVEEGLALAKEKGIPVFRLPAADEAKAVAALKPIWEKWVAEVLGYPGGKQVKEFLKDQIAYRNSILPEPFTIITP